MSSEMTKLRKEDLSLYYYLKDIVLSSFIEQEELVPLCYMPEISTSTSYVYEALSTMEPSPTERGRGWIYFDTDFDACLCNSATCSGTPEQQNRVTLYYTTVSGAIETNTPINVNEYMVDYLDGRIVTSGTYGPETAYKPTYVDYWWNYVSLVDEWAVVEAADPPVVVIDMHGTDKTGYQLGPGKKVVRKVDLHIFASNTAERNDIVETLYNGLYNRSCPLYEFPKGTVLDYDGTWYGRRESLNRDTMLFDRTTISGVIGNLEFYNVSARHVNLPLLMTKGRGDVMLSDLNAYRSKVSFELVSYTQQ